MQHSVALQRYLQRHIERDLPASPRDAGQWQRALVIPAYGESLNLLDRLRSLPAGAGRTLVILVLNRPDSDPDAGANRSLRRAITDLADAAPPHLPLSLSAHTDLLPYDLEQLVGPTPAAMGVGLARKAGCDIALHWMSQGSICGDWIYSSDADAQLPEDYFLKLETTHRNAVAAVFPFSHQPGADADCNAATALYELRLHHYVLGLEHAGSPYACHTLGSCLAVRAEPYARVRGFPRRAGGEDFYLLNKLAKLGPVVRLDGACIELESRASTRVPFGTGPAVLKIMAAGRPEAVPLFYHPACFAALRGLLQAIPLLREQSRASLPGLLRDAGLQASLADASCGALSDLGLGDAVAHCRRQGTTPEQFLRQFHQWFDAFRSLKFIHALSGAGWPQQPLSALPGLQPQLWPAAGGEVTAVENLRREVRHHWGWTIPPSPGC